MRRATALVLLVALVSAGAWWIGSAQARSDVDRPVGDRCGTPAAVVVEVTRERLRSEVSARGMANTARSTSLDLVTSKLAASDVVTAVSSHVGQTVGSGDELLRVAERPLLVFQSSIPAYRDLHLGDVGADVAGLQAALRLLGHSIRDRDATLGPSTARAVRAAYEARGVASAERITSTPIEAGTPPPAPMVLPLGEYTTVEVLPATVTGLGVHIGGHLGDAGPDGVVLGSGPTVVRLDVPNGVASTIAVGAPSTLEPTAGGTAVSAEVARISTAPRDDGHGASVRTVTVVAAEAVPRGEYLGRVVIADSIRPGWVVPLSAVVTGERDASIRLAPRSSRSGPRCTEPRSTRLPVRVRIVSEGRALVEPVRGLDLRERSVVAPL